MERKTTSTNYSNEQELNQCPVNYTLNMIGGRWKVTIIWKLMSGTKRFSELKQAIGPISERMLTKQLKAMEVDGLVKREVFREVPPRVEYSLTSKGHSLKAVLDSILEWGMEELSVNS